MNRATEPGSEPLDHALGRSRGGVPTKIHQLVDGEGWLLVIALTAGRAEGFANAEVAAGRPRRQQARSRAPANPADAVLGDKAQHLTSDPELLRTKGIRAATSQPADQIAHRQRRGSWPPGYDKLGSPRSTNLSRCEPVDAGPRVTYSASHAR